VDLVVAGQNEIYPVRADSVPFSGSDPQPIRSINTVSVPLTFDVNRYFKWLWKPSHLLDTNLKSCGNYLRRRRRSLASKAKAFMNNQEPDLNPTPAETDSAKTNESNESSQRERSELPVDQRVFISKKSPNCVEKVQPSRSGP
jgi:hypothetical protein